MSKPVTVKITEDEDNLYLKYHFHLVDWVLIYRKEKDICLLLKGTRKADLTKMSQDEIEVYKEVLEYAIIYHHEKGDALEH